MPEVSTYPDVSTPLNDAAVVYVVQGGNSRKATVADIWNAIPDESNIRLQTAVAAAGQTAIDFTGIPAWVNRITVIARGLSTSGTSPVLIRLGDSGGIEATGYISTILGSNGGVIGHVNETTGFYLFAPLAGTDTGSGRVTISRESGNSWVADGLAKRSTTAFFAAAGDKTLSDVLTQLRITAANGTDTFDLGSVNVSWE